MHPFVSWYRTTCFLAFPWGVIAGVAISTEIPFSASWVAWCVATLIFVRWIFACNQIGMREFNRKHKAHPQFSLIGECFLWVGVGGINTGAAIAWHVARGYWGVAGSGILIGIAGAAYGIYAYPMAVRLLEKLAAPYSDNAV